MITEQDIERAINDRFAIREYLESLDPATEISVHDPCGCVYHGFLLHNFEEALDATIDFEFVRIITGSRIIQVDCADRFPCYVQRGWINAARRNRGVNSEDMPILTAEACIAVLDGMED